MTFAEKVQQAVEQTVINQLRDGKGISIPYNAVKIPPDFISECWALVDKEKIKQEVASILEKEFARRVVNKFEGEVANDIKLALNDKESREKVRAYIRENINSLV